MFNSNGMPFTMNVEPTGSNGGFGNDGWGTWIWIILILAIFGWGNNGNGWGGANGANANYVLSSDFATLQRMISDGNNIIERKLDTQNAGICDLGYTQAQLINGVSSNISATGQNILGAINNDTIANMQNTNAITAQLTSLGSQMASCCCEAKTLAMQNAADFNYRLAEQGCQTRQAIADASRDIIANQDASTRAILDFMTQDKIASLTAENQSLKLAASQANQNNYLIGQLAPQPKPAYIVQSPYASYNGYGCACNA